MNASRARMIWSVVTWTIVLAVVFPLIWMIVTSVKPQSELFSIPPTLMPETMTFEHYQSLLTDTPFLQYFRNSMILAVTTTVVVVALGTLGAYSLVRFKYRGRATLATLGTRRDGSSPSARFRSHGCGPTRLKPGARGGCRVVVRDARRESRGPRPEVRRVVRGRSAVAARAPRRRRLPAAAAEARRERARERREHARAFPVLLLAFLVLLARVARLLV